MCVADVTEAKWLKVWKPRRLDEARRGVAWKQWGPYLSDRQWGTVHEDDSDNGDAWSYFSDDQARSRMRPNEMVPLQIDLATGGRPYLFLRSRNPRRADP